VTEATLSCLNVDSMRGSARLKTAQWNGVDPSLIEDAIILIILVTILVPVFEMSIITRSRGTNHAYIWTISCGHVSYEGEFTNSSNMSFNWFVGARRVWAR